MRHLFIAGLLFGCANEVSSSLEPDFETDSLPDLSSSRLICDTNALPAPTPLKRLSNAHYRNSLTFLFSAPALQAPLATALATDFTRLPPDRDTGQTFASMDQRLTEEHVNVQFDLADGLASGVASTPERRVALAGTCAEEAPLSTECVDGFIRGFGRRAFRRPLSDEEVERFAELRGDGLDPAEILGNLVFSFLMAPQFLYVFEDAGQPLSGRPNITELTPWELASRLTFTFWQSPPDDSLLDAVASGAFETDEGYTNSARQIIEDPRSTTFVRSFFDQWFKIPEAVEFPNDPIFNTVSRDVNVDAGLYVEMRAEAHTLIDEFMENDRSYRDLLTTPMVMTQSQRLAEIYEVEAWDGSSEPPVATAAPRPGILTRSAVLLATGTTNPILRGAFLRREILCDDLEVPPDLPSEAFQFPEQEPDQSTREVVDAKTNVEGCAGCHALINPLGYAMESFDGLGKFRTEEEVLDSNGEILATVPIDPVIRPQLDLGDTNTVDTVEQLMSDIAGHPKTASCFARHLYRYAFRQDEDVVRDGCSLINVQEAIEAGSMTDALIALVTDDGFKQIVLEDAQ
ncbi:MAG: DUF1592 domain-containing protein [Myxococcota bacterium]